MNKLCTLILILLTACNTKEESAYVVADQSSKSTIYLDKNSNALVKWAVSDLVRDIESMSGKKFQIITVDSFIAKKQGIYIGSINDKLIKSCPIENKDQLQNQWENFIIKKQNKNLYLIGSDVRGTVFAVFDFAERIGISPWKWWADVTPEKKEKIIIKLPKDGIADGPAVQYRGIFLNDEDWGLFPWAAKTFEPEVGNIGPKTYEKIFQLLLRLKANTIWPAMHHCTKAFFTVPGNKEMAEKYHIFIGTSHAEPMLRNNVAEWNGSQYGDFNYFTNSDKVKEYWQQRIDEATNGDNIITLGMRGIHDSGMRGNATKQEKVALLEQIIDDQREMLGTTFDKPAEEIPQVFTLYKEVLNLYNNGLTVPDDVTLMWTDDNYGYIRRLSNEEEQKRLGGSGIYYHLSYWGRPHDYLWLSTISPSLIWYEMSKAYQNGAQKIWIANVGDIKPGEYNMEFFLDLAWGADDFDETDILPHLRKWAKREFGYQKANEIADVMQEYYRLAFLRKPEFMGWSQTEPTTPTTITGFSTNPDNNEVQRRIDAYTALYKKVESIRKDIDKDRQNAYFQLIEYPVKGAALMNFKFLRAQQSYITPNREEKVALTRLSGQAYEEIIALTRRYNNNTSGGKWQNMISMKPRNLPVFMLPNFRAADALNTDTIVEKENHEKPIFIQANDFSNSTSTDHYTWKSIDGLGYSDASITLFPFDNHHFTKDKPYVEYKINIEKPGEYTLEIRCLPTHANNYDYNVNVAFNEEEATSYNINTKGRSRTWKENVLRNYAVVHHKTSFNKKGLQTLKIYVNQTGIVLDQMTLIPENCPEFYEIVK